MCLLLWEAWEGALDGLETRLECWFCFIPFIESHSFASNISFSGSLQLQSKKGTLAFLQIAKCCTAGMGSNFFQTDFHKITVVKDVILVVVQSDLHLLTCGPVGVILPGVARNATEVQFSITAKTFFRSEIAPSIISTTPGFPSSDCPLSRGFSLHFFSPSLFLIFFISDLLFEIVSTTEVQGSKTHITPLFVSTFPPPSLALSSHEISKDSCVGFSKAVRFVNSFFKDEKPAAKPKPPSRSLPALSRRGSTATKHNRSPPGTGHIQFSSSSARKLPKGSPFSFWGSSGLSDSSRYPRTNPPSPPPLSSSSSSSSSPKGASHPTSGHEDGAAEAKFQALMAKISSLESRVTETEERKEKSKRKREASQFAPSSQSHFKKRKYEDHERDRNLQRELFTAKTRIFELERNITHLEGELEALQVKTVAFLSELSRSSLESHREITQKIEEYTGKLQDELDRSDESDGGSGNE